MTMRAMKQVFLAALMVAFAGCGGGGGGGVNNPPVNVPPADNELRFHGSTGLAGAGAAIAASAGEMNVEAVADEKGRYSLDVPLANLKEGTVLRLDIKGSGERGHIHFVSAFANAGELEDQAGADRILTSGEAAGVDASEVSTAKYAALYHANGGEHLQTTARFLELESKALTADRVSTMAAAARLAARDRNTLPAATDTTWKVLSKESAAQGFLAGLRSGAIDIAQKRAASSSSKTEAEIDVVMSTVEELLENPQPFTAAMLPDEYVMIERTRSDLELRAHVLQFNDDGTGTHTSSAGENPMTWAIDGEGRLVVTPAAGKRIISEAADINDETAFPQTQQEILGDLVFTLLSSGETVDLVTVLYDVADAEIGSSETFDPATHRVLLRALTAVRSGPHLAFDAAEFAGHAWAMPGVGSDVTQGREIVVRQTQPLPAHMSSETLLQFSEDGNGEVLAPDLETAAIAATGETFNWDVSVGGELVITFPDGSVVTYRKMGTDGMALDVLVITQDAVTSETLVNAGLAVAVDEDAAFTLSDVVGSHARFGNGAGSFELQNFAPLVLEYAYAPVADHKGNVDMPIWQELDRDHDKAWRVDAGDIRIGAFNPRIANPEQTSPFDPGCVEVENCYQHSQIRVIPLARDGDRVYTMEVQDDYYFTMDTAVLHGDVANRRISINYWDLETGDFIPPVETFTFTLSSTSYAPYVYQTVYVTAIAEGESEVMTIGSAVVSEDGAFTVTGSLPGGKEYTIGWYADVNGNQVCDEPPYDHAWTHNLATLTANVTLPVQHDYNFGVCQQ